MNPSPKPKGGKRPGAGRPKGVLNQSTIDKELLKEQLRKLVAAALAPMVSAQVSNAQGLKYLVTRDKKSGKFVRVTEAMARQMQGTEAEETIEVWEKEPSVSAFTDLMNRTIDQPAKPAEEHKHEGHLTFGWKGD